MIACVKWATDEFDVFVVRLITEGFFLAAGPASSDAIYLHHFGARCRNAVVCPCLLDSSIMAWMHDHPLLVD